MNMTDGVVIAGLVGLAFLVWFFSRLALLPRITPVYMLVAAVGDVAFLVGGRRFKRGILRELERRYAELERRQARIESQVALVEERLRELQRRVIAQHNTSEGTSPISKEVLVAELEAEREQFEDTARDVRAAVAATEMSLVTNVATVSSRAANALRRTAIDPSFGSNRDVFERLLALARE